MIILMLEDLKLTEEPLEDDETKWPEGWYYEEDMSVIHEGELDSNMTGRPPMDMYDDGILDEFKQLQQAGVRGEIHLADSCSGRYTRYSLMDSGLFHQLGEVRWTSKLMQM